MIETINPIKCPKGHVQHLMVIETVTINPLEHALEPKVMKIADMSWLKMLRFWESTPSCS